MKTKFCDDYRIAAAYENKGLNWPEVKTEDGVDQKKFSIFLMSCKNAMEGSKYPSKLAQPETIQKLVLKLPNLWTMKPKLLPIQFLEESWKTRSPEQQEPVICGKSLRRISHRS